MSILALAGTFNSFYEQPGEGDIYKNNYGINSLDWIRKLGNYPLDFFFR